MPSDLVPDIIACMVWQHIHNICSVAVGYKSFSELRISLLTDKLTF